ncbi:MAG: hypothetical protein WDZ29_06040 [Balneolaceae bacterium]
MVNAVLIKFILFGNLIIVCFGCSGSIKIDPPETVSNVLNEFVASEPFHYLNLDELDTQYIQLNENNIIYSIIDDVDLQIGHLSKFTQIGDRLYIYDGIGNAIFEINFDGTADGPLTSEGAGPGEHGIIRNLKSNSWHIYAVDASNGRTNVYSSGMNFIGQENNLSFLDLNDSLLLMENSLSRGVAPNNPNQGRLVIYSMDNLADTVRTMMPRIIPAGYQPQMFNTPRVSLNRENDFVANYYFLPWLFVFDELHNHTRTLIFEYSVFEEMDIPPMDFFKELTNEGFGGIRPITEFKLMDNGDIFFTVRRELFRLTLNSDNTYQMAGKYQFNHPSAEDPLWISDVFQTDDKSEILIGSWEYLFRFELP